MSSVSSIAASLVGSQWPDVVKFTHPPVHLTEMVDGERLTRVVAYLNDVGEDRQGPDDGQPAPRKRPMTNRPGDDLRVRMFPQRGVTFDKNPDALSQWSRDREYTMSRTHNDHRFQAPVKLVKSSIRDYVTAPVSAHLDIENCNYSLLVGFLEEIVPGMLSWQGGWSRTVTHGVSIVF